MQLNLDCARARLKMNTASRIMRLDLVLEDVTRQPADAPDSQAPCGTSDIITGIIFFI